MIYIVGSHRPTFNIDFHGKLFVNMMKYFFVSSILVIHGSDAAPLVVTLRWLVALVKQKIEIRDNGEYYSGGLGVHYILEKNNGSITEST